MTSDFQVGTQVGQAPSDFTKQDMPPKHLTSYVNAPKGQQILKANYDFLNSPKKQMKLTILSNCSGQ